MSDAQKHQMLTSHDLSVHSSGPHTGWSPDRSAYDWHTSERSPPCVEKGKLLWYYVLLSFSFFFVAVLSIWLEVFFFFFFKYLFHQGIIKILYAYVYYTGISKSSP